MSKEVPMRVQVDTPGGRPGARPIYDSELVRVFTPPRGDQYGPMYAMTIDEAGVLHVTVHNGGRVNVKTMPRRG